MSTVSIAQFDVDLNGRVDFQVTASQAFTDAVTVTGATTLAPFTAVTGGAAGTATFADEAALEAALAAVGGTVTRSQGKAKTERDFDTVGRVDINVSQQTGALNYGTFVRLDVDPDAQAVSDVDAHVFLGGDFGRIKFGTDIDAFQSVFDTSQISVGPLSPGNSVAFGGTLDGSSEEQSSLVYQTPTLMGFRVETEFDEDDNWGASISYRGSVGDGDIEMVVGGESGSAVGAYAKGDMGDFTVLGFHMQDDDEESATGAGVAYHVGPLDVSLDASIARTNELNGLAISGVGGASLVNVTSASEITETDVVIGASYDLAPGMAVSGSVGLSENDRSGDAVNAAGRLRIKF